MSFEGYHLCLCEVGHQDTVDYDYAGDQPTPKCECGRMIVWSYRVDQTNDGGVAPVLQRFATDDHGDQHYLPSNAGKLHCFCADDALGPPTELRPVVWQDLDHPTDGPFQTEAGAWNNKSKYWRKRSR